MQKLQAKKGNVNGISKLATILKDKPMIQINDIYSVVSQINQQITSQGLQAEIQNLNRFRQSMQTNPNAILQQVYTCIDKITKILSSINTDLWTSEQLDALERLGINKLIGRNATNYLESIKYQIQSNPALGSNLIQNIQAELNQVITKPTQLYSLLQPFGIKPTVQEFNSDEGIIEITFDGKVAIDDFKEAKEQMNDWFIIIEGYSRLLGVTREEFEIISMSKNSPSKFKIKTTIKNVSLVLGVVASLLLIEKTYLENRLMIEKLKQTSLIPDSLKQKELIEEAENHLSEKIKKDLDQLVDKTLKEHNIQEGNGDIQNNFSKGIENQYNFIVSGGNVNIQVIDEKVKQQIDTLQKTKNEIKQIKDAYENQKALNSPNQDSTNTEG